MTKNKVVRGVDYWTVSKVLHDDVDGITYDKPVRLTAIQHVVREDPEESAKVYGDNKALIVVKGEGSPTATFTAFTLSPKDLAFLLGHKTVGSAMVATNNPEEVYFGIHYRLKNTDGSYTWVTIAKAKFLAPSDDVETQNDGTDVTLMELQAELLPSICEFDIDGEKQSFKYITLEQDRGEDFTEKFMTEQQTPETIKTIGGAVAVPVSNIEAGEVAENTKVTLKTNTVNAKILYTVDGSDPAENNGTLYELPIEITGDMTIKAIAIKDNYENSEIVELTYTMVA